MNKINTPEKAYGLETPLEHILTHKCKAEMIAYMGENPDKFDELLLLALSNKQPYSRKATFLLQNCMSDNEPFLYEHTGKIIELLPTVCESQQRIFLMILQRMQMNRNEEKKLFDICISIWNNMNAAPAVKYNAFKILVNIARKYPELSDTIKNLTTSHYMDSLSKGTKHSVSLIVSKL